jgi:hypothetical protein
VGTLLAITAQAAAGMSPAIQPVSGLSSCNGRPGRRVLQYLKASMA